MRHAFTLLLALTIFSCAQKDGITISGKYAGDIGDGMVYLELIKDDTRTVVDSFFLAPDGEFSRDVKVEEPSFYRLNFNNRNMVNMILNDTDVIIEEPEGEGRYLVKGSKDTDFITALAVKKNEFGRQVQQLNAEFMEARNNGDMQTMNDIQEKYMDMQQILTREMKKDIWQMDHSIAGILAITYLENPEEEFAFLDSLATKYKQQIPNSSYAKGLIAKVDNLRKLAIGSDAPEINLPDPDGNNITLSSLKGNYVLIDFWAAWCKPCRMENPNVVRMYDTYHDKGFEILGVSLDRKKDAWVEAIEKDQLTWLHVSDLSYFQSKAAQTYQINAIPATYLIGPDGKIVAKNLRGESLESKLREIFGQSIPRTGNSI